MRFFIIIEFLVLGAIEGLMVLFSGIRKDDQEKGKEIEAAKA